MGRRSAHVQETPAQAERGGEVKGKTTKTHRTRLFSVDSSRFVLPMECWLFLPPLGWPAPELWQKKWLTPHHRAMFLFQYLHRANSVTWNPHKMMGVPLQCSAILVRERVRWTDGRTDGQTDSFCSSPPSSCRIPPDSSQPRVSVMLSVAGTVARLQLHVCWLPVPARQTV